MIIAYLSFEKEIDRYIDVEADLKNKIATIILFPVKTDQMKIELSWSEGLRTLVVKTSYPRPWGTAYEFVLKAVTKKDKTYNKSKKYR